MTVHDPELIGEIRPLLENILTKTHEWTLFAHDNDRDFAAAARWLAHHPKSPLFERIRPRTLAIQWKTDDDGETGWTTNRTTTTPVTTPTGRRIGRIRFRAPRTPRTLPRTTPAPRTRKAA